MTSFRCGTANNLGTSEARGHDYTAFFVSGHKLKRLGTMGFIYNDTLCYIKSSYIVLCQTLVCKVTSKYINVVKAKAQYFLQKCSCSGVEV